MTTMPTLEDRLTAALRRQVKQLQVDSDRVDPRSITARDVMPSIQRVRRPRRRLAAAAALLVLAGAAAWIRLAGGEDHTVTVAVSPDSSLQTPRAAGVLGTHGDVEVFVVPRATAEMIEAIEDQIRNRADVERVEFFSQEQAHARLEQGLLDNPELADEVDPESLPPSFRVWVRDPSRRARLALDLEQMVGIYAIEIGGAADYCYRVVFEDGVDAQETPIFGSPEDAFSSSSALVGVHDVPGIRVTGSSSWSDGSRPDEATVEVLPGLSSTEARDIAATIQALPGVASVPQLQSLCPSAEKPAQTQTTEPTTRSAAGSVSGDEFGGVDACRRTIAELDQTSRASLRPDNSEPDLDKAVVLMLPSSRSAMVIFAGAETMVWCRTLLGTADFFVPGAGAGPHTAVGPEEVVASGGEFGGGSLVVIGRVGSDVAQVRLNIGDNSAIAAIEAGFFAVDVRHTGNATPRLTWTLNDGTTRTNTVSF